MADVISVSGLRKRLGRSDVLDGLSLSAAEGSVVGLLGPNGAGKTTTVRVLSTLLKPDAGTVEICGVDVARDPSRVRHLIGLTGQFAAVDPILTGRENLELVARLYRIRRAEARRRAGEVIERFGLSEVAGQQVRTYSGGMRRRLDLAASILIRPRVLFLDEPTTGLDLEARLGLWDEIQGLARGGATILLTTQYLDEADHLADSVTVLDHGRTVAQGTPDQLKTRIGGDRVEFLLADPADLDRAVAVVRHDGVDEPVTDRILAQITVPLVGDVTSVNEHLRALHAAGIALVTHSVRRPTLDDVFLTLTGRRIKPGAPPPDRSGSSAHPIDEPEEAQP
ncbi:ATP-binding cassette domain-containing protein [Kineosporia sp. NBRC 101731]|uniref:ATP-binding cassette domain-containing protein n=1 Tax=Kineosporia sp. NBRC 101731 TaxID=3032199 RepID=UPI0024A15720|nr:ATP-binding cassette domain-containing protein [Kineosporia sp. NBRC 101731]GLY30394.1 daunorubicin resistance protein DrrA family ABC transporter ATP-binding protein [Kineosporia sp. NBRC 101731]